MNAPKLMSYEEIMTVSDKWWDDTAPDLEHPGEDGGMYVVAYAMCAISGAIVGLVVGLLLG